ncbi:hypothetical protein NERG_01227 [Nematocida ausubeli]|uniref:Uncharacterized protein n=1 Tax=Nematocida ausubeli (strain ATCC PRA-371 / ERTm2) TaxID=1913371 RepID=H8ZBY4_NEMA1|nr:hypothetical protein NERG_01227 [Nematocida ausubeli]
MSIKVKSISSSTIKSESKEISMCSTILEEKSNTNLESSAEDKEEHLFFHNSMCILLFCSRLLFSIVFNFLAGIVFVSADFFDENHIHSRTLLLFVFGWVFTMIYLLLTIAIFPITNIYVHFSDKKTKRDLIISASWLSLVLIVTLGMGIWKGLLNKSDISKCYDPRSYISLLVVLYYAGISSIVIGLLRSLSYAAKLKDPYGEYKGNILRVKRASKIILAAILPLAFGYYVFFVQLYTHLPETLCGLKNLSES